MPVEQNKILVVMIHGIGDGRGEKKFLANLEGGIRRQLQKQIKQNSLPESSNDDFVFLHIEWFRMLQEIEDALWSIISKSFRLRYIPFRKLIINFFADALAYQPSKRNQTIYDQIHLTITEKIKQQIDDGNISKDSLVCFVGYSLGSVIASNYIYDLQNNHRDLVSYSMKKVLDEEDYPALRGETIASFYTMGAPIALWSLRHRDFGEPVHIPSPTLTKASGSWYNFYERSDLLAYPLKNLNNKYRSQVSEDIEVKIPGFLYKWNPMSHTQYCHCKAVHEKIASDLVLRWKEIENRN